ncbi:MAG: hypothetical protein ABI847_05945 [Anaerolineales bacterium]
MSSLRIPLGYLLAAGLFLWPLVLHPGDVPVRAGGQESDLLISHLPNAAYLRESLATYGQWPLWNGQILAGQPFAADPLSGMWYPPNLLLLLPIGPLPALFNLLFILHLAWAGYGVFRLLRAEGLPAGPAFFGGLAFAGTPKLIAHLAAGHVSLVFAVAWTPWLLLAAAYVVARPGPWRGALVGGVLAVMFLADVRWPAYTALLAGAYGLITLWRVRRSSPAVAGPSLKVWLVAAGAAVGMFLLLSAILLVPLLELIRYSSRSALSLADAGIYSLPPFPYLAGMVIPLYGVIHEWVTYAGLAPLLLALVGIRRRPFWLAAAVVAALFALGTNGFLFPVVFRWLPGASLLRVPARAWFIVSLAVCLLAAHGLNSVLQHWRMSPGLGRYAALGLPIVLVVTALDLVWMNNSLLTAKAVPQTPPAAVWLTAQPGLFSVYSSSASLPLPDTLQHVEGVDPLHLAALADFVAAATHIHASGYSVSVPALYSRDGSSTPAPEAEALGWLNVKYVAAQFDVQAGGLTLVKQFGATRIYENTLVHPRAWLEGGSAQVVEWSPNRIVVRTARAERAGLPGLGSAPEWPAGLNRNGPRPAARGAGRCGSQHGGI